MSVARIGEERLRPVRSGAFTLLRPLAVGAALVVLGAHGAAIASAQGAAPLVTATVTPSDFTLTPGRSGTGILLVTNTAKRAPASVRVHTVAGDTAVHVRMQKQTARIRAKASVPFAFTVTRTREGIAQDVNVRFLVRYRPRGRPRTNPRGIVVATVTVKAVATAALVEAALQTNGGNVNEHRPGLGTLVIANKREEPVRVEAIHVAAPPTVEVTLGCPGGAPLVTPPGEAKSFTDCGLEVGGRSQETLPMTLRTPDAVIPGKRTLLVKLGVSDAVGEARGSVVTTAAFDVDIFAESDLLKAVGVPAFLLLPGVLVVVLAWFGIAKLSPWRRAAGGLPAADSIITSATITAVLGFGISLLVAWAYPWLTRTIYPRFERDYLNAYGFRDFYYVFLHSFVIAFAVWTVALLVGAVLVPLGRYVFVPERGDPPAILIRKLKARDFPVITWFLSGRRTAYPSVEVKVNGGVLHGLLESTRARDKDRVLPRIVVSLNGGPDGVAGEIERQVETGRARDVARAVERAVKRGHATLAYRDGDVSTPDLFDETSIAPTGQQHAIVSVSGGD